VSLLQSDFLAPPWLSNPHLQTLSPALPFWAPPRAFRPVDEEVLRFALPWQEGGALDARAWWASHSPRRAVVLIHGVAGSIDSRYLVRAAVAVHRAGMHAIRLNLRGAGDSVAHAPHLYHAGLTEDPRVAIEALAAHARVDGVVLVGFSLGGNVALKLAGEWGTTPHPAARAVVAVSAPLDLVQTSRSIERVRSTPYRRHILRGLVRQARAFAAHHPHRAPYQPHALRRLRTVREFDEAVIVPMHDFASADDYYRRASSGWHLSRITVPTLLLHADDDPLVPSETLHPWLSEASNAVTIERSARGGHLGWLSGLSESAWIDNWAMRRVLHAASSVNGAGSRASEHPSRAHDRASGAQIVGSRAEDGASGADDRV
jgi:predicted alpha/beta-fold hydrolase